MVGGNLNDQLKPLEEAVAAVKAVLEAACEAGTDVVLNARTDELLWADPGARRQQALAEAIRNGQAFFEARAPDVFVPGIVARNEIKLLVEASGQRRLTVISVPGRSKPASELEELGVARVSSGPFTPRVALTALQDVAAALNAGGALPEGTRPLNRSVAPRNKTANASLLSS